MRIAVTTPTGNIGSRVLERLLPTQHEITVIVRDPSKLSAAVRQRARIVTGSLDDAQLVTGAFAGADAVFLLVPPNFGAPDWDAFIRSIGKVLVAAVAANGIKRVVFLSSVGAGKPGLGPVTPFGDIERDLFASAPNVVTLRAGYFMENLLGSVGGIKADGVLYQPHPADMPIGLVATRDIGDVAAAELVDASWSGHRIREVLGAADVSFAQVTTAIGNAIGRPVKYVEVPVAAVVQILLGMGASNDVAAKYGEMMSGFNALRFVHDPRTAASTTPTTIDEFARTVLAPAILASA